MPTTPTPQEVMRRPRRPALLPTTLALWATIGSPTPQVRDARAQAVTPVLTGVLGESRTPLAAVTKKTISPAQLCRKRQKRKTEKGTSILNTSYGFPLGLARIVTRRAALAPPSKLLPSIRRRRSIAAPDSIATTALGALSACPALERRHID